MIHGNAGLYSPQNSARDRFTNALIYGMFTFEILLRLYICRVAERTAVRVRKTSLDNNDVERSKMCNKSCAMEFIVLQLFLRL